MSGCDKKKGFIVSLIILKMNFIIFSLTSKPKTTFFVLCFCVIFIYHTIILLTPYHISTITLSFYELLTSSFKYLIYLNHYQLINYLSIKHFKSYWIIFLRVLLSVILFLCSDGVRACHHIHMLLCSNKLLIKLQ